MVTTVLTLCPLGIFSRFICCLLIFLKINFLAKILSGIQSVSNSFDPDQSLSHLSQNFSQRIKFDQVWLASFGDSCVFESVDRQRQTTPNQFYAVLVLNKLTLFVLIL